MQSESKKAVSDAIEQLDTTKEVILIGLGAHPELSSIRLHIDNHLRMLSNRIKAMTGIAPNHETIPDAINFPPLQQLEGKVFNTKVVESKELEPKNEEAENLKSRIIQLQDALDKGYTNEQVLENYATAADQLVVRGLAKKANHPQFATGEINDQFLNEVREGLAAKGEKSNLDTTALIAQIKSADTKEKVEELAKGSDNEDVQNAALERIIQLEDAE